MTSRIGIAGCEGDPVDPATVQHYAELGNESAQAALAAIRMADAHDELRLARRALHITRSPIAWGRLPTRSGGREASPPRLAQPTAQTAHPQQLLSPTVLGDGYRRLSEAGIKPQAPSKAEGRPLGQSRSYLLERR